MNITKKFQVDLEVIQGTNMGITTKDYITDDINLKKNWEAITSEIISKLPNNIKLCDCSNDLNLDEVNITDEDEPIFEIYITLIVTDETEDTAEEIAETFTNDVIITAIKKYSEYISECGYVSEA